MAIIADTITEMLMSISTITLMVAPSEKYIQHRLINVMLVYHLKLSTLAQQTSWASIFMSVAYMSLHCIYAYCHFKSMERSALF